MSAEVCWIHCDHPFLDVLHVFECQYQFVILFVDVQLGLCRRWRALTVPESMRSLLIIIWNELFEDSDACRDCCHSNRRVNHQVGHKVCSFCYIAGQLEEACRGDWGKILRLWHELRSVGHHNDHVEVPSRGSTIFWLMPTIHFALRAYVSWTTPLDMSV